MADKDQKDKGAKRASHNMRLVGHDDLQGRSAYQPIIQEQDGRWIAYVGHHNGSAFNPLTGMTETNGVSIVDVTVPKHPVYLHHIPGDSGAQMVRTCRGEDLPGPGDDGTIYLLRSDGNLRHQVFDVTDPSNPVLVSTPSTGLDGTHKNYWECETGIAYLISGVPGWRTNRMMQVFDLSDPANPQFIRNWGLDGHQPGSTVDPVPQSAHGCISVPERERVYCGNGTNSNGVVVILDREVLLDVASLGNPAFPTSDELNAPIIAQLNTPRFMGAHTTFPVLDIEVEELEKEPQNSTRDFLVVVNEALRNECSQNETNPNRFESRQMVFLADITDEQNPWPTSNFNVPESEGDYCDEGGRFGAHASNESFTPIFYRKLVFFSWFNAGVRGVDIRDPFNPKEVAFFVPEITPNTDDRDGKFAIQTNNVEVDERGLIYTADRANTGLHIIELTGKAKKIADLP